MKRYEFIKIVALMDWFSNDFESEIHFDDVKRWSKEEKYISYAAEMGWIDIETELFRPNEAITLGEAQEILDIMTWTITLPDEDSDWEMNITKEDWALMIYDQLQ